MVRENNQQTMLKMEAIPKAKKLRPIRPARILGATTKRSKELGLVNVYI